MQLRSLQLEGQWDTTKLFLMYCDLAGKPVDAAKAAIQSQAVPLLDADALADETDIIDAVQHTRNCGSIAPET